ncbi:MAG TPA: hypothetical protein DEG17_21685 [Cyanobacteria bacterium UBA11149]|nr:hypothetical protein [Cyanobacteria bacterium UBA11366]HBK65471.1 hypothetical protein [Cyanobacteria bacterium UBA11166]HBR72468.1 hypothetical protein [Cyanobacteria bacterium UBA11159]HBW91398.1 hypothetical protein [Cyanobacteria bacterium UBA11149]HCA96169.1 hypothetical protein [Cyanobacteria bacterium UBA9226]
MKASLERDFTVSVRHQIWEELSEKYEYYRGIYSVNLNFLVTVMFVPGFEINEEQWPPVLPENIDDVSSENEARLFTTALSDYTVTPQTRWAGKAEKIPLPSGKEDGENSDINLQTGVVFYVSDREFDVFSQELSALAQQTSGAHDSVKISEIKELEVSKFLLAKIVESPHFSTRDLKILTREDKYSHIPLVGETKLQPERVA